MIGNSWAGATAVNGFLVLTGTTPAASIASFGSAITAGLSTTSSVAAYFYSAGRASPSGEGFSTCPRVIRVYYGMLGCFSTTSGGA